MKVIFHKNFKKRYKKFRALQEKIDQRLVLFMKDPFDSTLNNHALAGKYKGHRSINIDSDFRAIYELVNQNTAYFITIDKHDNLYK